jgi:DNA-binding phage protein
LNDAVALTLPINASNVNYTNSDQTTVSLSTYINDVVNDTHATIDKINQIFPLSAANVNYTNENEVTKTVQERLREIDEFYPSEVLKNISNITKAVNDTIEDVKDIAESIEHVTEIAGTAIGVAEVAEAVTVAIAALEGSLGGKIALAAGVAGGAVLSIEILSKSLENINATQVKYTKTDETTVTLDEYLKNIVNDIEATGDHVSQSLAALEGNALTIAKINEINPYFGIYKPHTLQPDYANFPGKKR